MAFSYKGCLQRIYNALMTCVVSDKDKSKYACELLGKGFNRLISGPYEQYFIDAGVPEEWYSSPSGNQMVPADFEDHMIEFEEADEGLKW